LEKPLFTVSGLRGIVGKSLTPEIISSYTMAFFKVYGQGLYVLGRDTRPHGEMVSGVVKSTLLALGANVLDIGIAPTPTVAFTVKEKKAKGGIVITASHNPIEWNALKFINSLGRFPFEDEMETIKNNLNTETKWAEWNEVGKLDENIEIGEKHIEKILDSPYVNLNLIKSKRFTVAVDSVNGATYRLLPKILETMGCNVIKLNCKPIGVFPHNPEPKKENLEELHRLLIKGEADFGFASDPDGDRIAIGIKKMGIVGEEYTLPLSTMLVLERKKGPVVTNLSSSMLIETITEQFGVPLYRTPVGEANVIKKMIEVDAAIGGEGNGGVILPDLNLTRDGLVAVALITTLAAQKGVENLLQGFPSYYFIKEKFPKEGLLPKSRILETFKGGEIDTRDGIHIRFEKSWIHIRPSNTEPIVRVYIEAESEEEGRELFNEVKKLLLL